MRSALASTALLLAQLAFCQFPHTRTLEIRSGQEKPSIHHIVQDADGSLWLGTDIGLLRTDGERVEPILRSENATITALSTASADVLIAMDDGTILRCAMDRCDTLLFDQRLRDRRVNDILADSAGRVWIGTHGNGIFIFDRERGTLSQVKGLRDGHVNGLSLLADGRVVAATDQGLALCEDSTVLRSLGEQEGVPDNLTLCVTSTGTGTIWAGTDRSGAFSWDPRSGDISLLDSSWTKGKITSIVEDDGTVWSGTGEGSISVHEPSPGGSYSHDGNMHRAVIHDMLVDRNGAVWWCNGTDELFRSDPAILFIPEHEGIDLRNARALCSDGKNRIWFATERGLFHHPVGFAGHQQMTRVPLELDEKKPIVSLEAAQDGTIWAGTFGGGAIRIAANGTISYFNSSNSRLNDNVLSVRTMGNDAWFATLEGLYHYNERTGFAGDPLPIPGFVFDVLPLENGSILAATDGSGILELSPGGKGWRSLGEQEGRFYSLIRAANGAAWAAGPGTGLCEISSQGRACHHADSPAFGADLFALAQHGDHLLVLGSTATLAYDLRDGSATDVTARLGLEGIQIGLNAVDKDSDGSIWLATDRGLLRMRPTPWHLSDRIITAIRAIRVGGVLVDRTEPIVLPYDHDRITIEFTGIHWVDPGRVRFQYRSGSDPRGQVTRDRQVHFTNLPPGEHTFQVRAFAGELPLDDEWETIHFTITAPFWRRPWIIVLAAIIISVITALIVRGRDRRLHERERIEQEKVRFQLEALRSQVDPHFLFNSFNTLMELIETDASRAMQHVDKLSLFFRNILLVRDKEVIGVEEELRLLENYFSLEQHRFGNAIEMNVDVDLHDRVRSIVPLTLQLLVENSLKHNVATISQPLRIDVRSQEGYLVVSNPVQARISAPRSTGFGLESIQKRYAALTPRPIRIERHNDRFTVWIPLLEADESVARRG